MSTLPTPTTPAPGFAARMRAIRQSAWWPWAVGIVSATFVLGIMALLFHQARNMDWPAVWTAVLDTPRWALLGGACLAFTSHAVYSTFDLFGRRCTGHCVSVPRTLGTTLIAYPFTLNLGSILGGASVRYRLYSRQGVCAADIGQVIGWSILTNWLGYYVLAAVVFWFWTPTLPPNWEMDGHQLRWVGLGLAALTVAYLLACAFRKGRAFVFNGIECAMPTHGAAWLQVGLSVANWMVMAGAVWCLTEGRAPYIAALATILLGAIAGLISRIPAGLGVLEAVGVAVLSPYLPAPEALAVILTYRVIYFLIPLGLSGLAFAMVELVWRRKHPSSVVQ